MAAHFRLKNHNYLCPKIVAGKWGLPPKNVADPEKRLSVKRVWLEDGVALLTDTTKPPLALCRDNI